MIQKEQKATVMHRVVTPNGFNEQVVSYEDAGTIKVIINYKAGAVNLSENVYDTRYTITGVTASSLPKEEDKLVVDDKTYHIDAIIETNRMRILSLTEEREVK